MIANVQQLRELWRNKYVENAADEMIAVLDYVRKLTPFKAVLEIGVCFGGSLKLWEAVIPADGIVIGIDNHPAIFKRLAGEERETRTNYPGIWEIESQAENVGKLVSNKTVYVINEDSSSPASLASVKEILGEEKIDFIFHDGIHYGPGPVYDYANFQHLLRTGGLLCIADVSGIVDHPPIPTLGTQALYHALPEPKEPQVNPHRQGMALWWKQEDFILDAEQVVKRNPALIY